MTDPHLATPSGKPRARALGIPFDGTPGPLNAITDVPGVEVGYTTVIEGDDVRTGVTGIHPRGKANPHDACAAGVYSLNGNGEMTGWAWIEESGTVSLPIAITSTAAVGIAQAGINSWVHERFPDPNDEWALPVAAETWDGFLHKLNDRRITEAEVHAALDTAASGPIEEGSVGGGTGMNCCGFKAGSGTASRQVAWGPETFTVGAFVQANFGSRSELTIAGVKLGEALKDDDPLGSDDWVVPPGAGSIIVILATDAPLLPTQMKAMARRAPTFLVISSSPSRRRTRARSPVASRSASRRRTRSTSCASCPGRASTTSSPPRCSVWRRRSSTRLSPTRRCMADRAVASPRYRATASSNYCARPAGSSCESGPGSRSA